MQQKILIEQGQKLSTLVGDGLTVLADYSISGSDQSRYYIDLKTVDGKIVGDMDAMIVEKNGDKLKHLYITDMNNTSGHRHVGNALHEYAFRMSVALGAEGRIRFNAVRNSHIFHYNSGFLLEGQGITENFVKYYLRLADQMITSKKTGEKSKVNLGADYLYLPHQCIVENLKKYDLSLDLITKATEDEKNRSSVANRIGVEAQQNSLAIQLILGIDHITSPAKIEATKTFHARKKLNLTYYRKSETTELTIFEGSKALLEKLPLDTEEKKQQFEITLIGIVICIMALQDEDNGQQKIFDNQYLCPEIKFNQILETYGEQESSQMFMSVGEAVLIYKTLSFDGKMHPNVFPVLQAIDEFKSIFVKYQLMPEISENAGFQSEVESKTPLTQTLMKFGKFADSPKSTISAQSNLDSAAHTQAMRSNSNGAKLSL